MAKACARHSLLKSKEQAETLKRQLKDGADFASLAKKHSQCHSAKRGGEFGPGKMLKAFDNVVFKKPLLTVHGPIKTKFGYYHLIETIYRT